VIFLQKSEIFYLALKYVIELAKKKPYNIQTIALNKKIKRKLMNKLTIFDQDYNHFIQEYPIENVQDNVLKNDGLNFRNMYLISPFHYLYYNYQVFLLFYYLNEVDSKLANLNYNNQKVYYAGKIELEEKNISKNAVFNMQYSNYMNERNKLENSSRILSLDLKGFFDKIRTDDLIKKITILVRKNKEKINPSVKKVIRNINEFFKVNSFNTLPQLHYSIASSYLSQIYLHQSSLKFEKLLDENDSFAVRYVDDVFVGFFEEKSDKKINNFIKTTSDILWDDGLILNTQKTRKIKPEDFKSENFTMSLSINQDLFHSEDSEEIVNQGNRMHKKNINFKIIRKVYELLADEGALLIEFFEEIHSLFENDGYDFDAFNKILNKYISIEGNDVSKVLNTLMFNKSIQIPKTVKSNVLNLTGGIKLYPEFLTQLYIMFSKDLQDQNYNNKLFNEIITETYFSHRELITTKHFIVQYKYNKDLLNINNEIIQKSMEYNPEYLKFVLKFCM